MRKVNWILTLVVGLSLPILAAVQGFLPATSSTATAPAPAHGPLVIGQAVNSSLIVYDAGGKRRTLLSYKAPIEVMVLGFFAAECPANQKAWYRLGRLYDEYKDWHVSFVAVNEGASLAELKVAVAGAGLNRVDFLEDPDRKLASFFAVHEIPTLVILDESGVLRYHGPVAGAPAPGSRSVFYSRKALNAVIGHTDPVPDPEPPPAGGCALP